MKTGYSNSNVYDSDGISEINSKEFVEIPNISKERIEENFEELPRFITEYNAILMILGEEKLKKLSLKMSTQQLIRLDKLFTKLLLTSKDFPTPNTEEEFKFKIEVPEEKEFKESYHGMSRFFQEEMRRQLEPLLKSGLIKKIERKDAKCISNPIFVRKSDGTWRLCIDYRRLNKIVELDDWFLESILDKFDKMDPSAMFYGVFDLTAGFHNIELEEKSKLYSCFYGPDGEVYQFNVMTFGHKNAPAHFTKWMIHIFGNNKGIIIYCDDILIEGANIDELLDRIEVIVDIIVKNNLGVNLKKVQVDDSVVIFGSVRDSIGIRIDPKRLPGLKLQYIEKRKQLLSVLAMLRFLAPGVENLNLKISKFNKYTSSTKDFYNEGKTWKNKKGNSKAKFFWNDTLQNELQLICDEIECVTYRYIPDWSKKFFIAVDSSDYGFGGYLYQLGENEERLPILFFSKGYTEPMSKWAIVEKELYALIYALQKCRRYVLGRKFTVYTDHKPLIWMVDGVKQDGVSSKIFRWLYFSSEFDFDIVHVPGNLNIVPDTLSRYPFVKRLSDNMVPESAFNPVNTIEDVNKVFATVVTETTLEDSWLKLKNDVGSNDSFILPDVISHNEVDVFEVVIRSLLQKKKLPDFVDEKIYSDVVEISKKFLDKLKLVNDRLCYVVGGNKDQQNFGKRFYVPRHKRAEFLRFAHDHPTQGHVGYKKTLLNIVNKYWWPEFEKDVLIKTTTCDVCQKFKNRPTLKSELHPFEPVSVKGRICIDLIGPLPVSDDGNKWIVVITNAASKYVCAFAMPDKVSETVTRNLLVNYLLVYGFPYEVFSDQGSEFISNLNKELCSVLGITRAMASVAHPSSNGQVERKNGFLKTILKAISKPDQTNWDRMLPFAVFAMNTTVPRGFLHTPFFLTFGVEHLSMLDVVNNFKPKSVTLKDWYNGLVNARKLSAYLDEKVRWEGKEKIDIKTIGKEACVGDLVLVKFRVPVGSSKSLSIKQQGPFKITSLDKGTAKLENLFCKDDVIVRNVIHLTNYNQGEEMLMDFEYEVDQIIEEKKVEGETLFRIRWKNLGPDDDSWRTKEELNHCSEILNKWKLGKENKPKKEIVVIKKSSVKEVLAEGLYDVSEILGHKNKRKTFRFDVLYQDKKDLRRKRTWLNQGQIGDQELVTLYLEKNNLENNKGLLKEIDD